jgi:hypothetical protein
MSHPKYAGQVNVFLNNNLNTKTSIIVPVRTCSNLRAHCPQAGSRFLLAFMTAIGLAFSSMALAQDNTGKTASATAPANPARDLVVSKCLQCHSDNIWRDQRQDARAWEAALYRMLARGAVWTGEDIKTMSGYLATDFGPNSPRAATTTR